MFKALAPIIAILIAIGLGFTYIKPTFESVKEVQKQSAEYDEAIQQADALQAELVRKINLMKSFDPVAMDNLKTMLPTEVKEVALVRDLDELTRMHKISLTSVSVEKSKEVAPKGSRAAAAAEASVGVTPEGEVPKHYTSRDIKLGLLGTYEDFRALMIDLEKSLVFLDVTDLTFTASEGDLMTFDITLRTYAFVNSVAK